MADLDPAHVEAVALVIDGCIESVWHASDERTRGPWKRAAERILTSIDPAVHSALLAALVRAGVLTEEDHVDWCTQEEYHDDDHYWMRCGLPADHDGEHRNSDTGRRWERRPDIDPEDVPKPRERRYVTRWEDVDA